MAATNSLVAKLIIDFPDIRFEPAELFRWSPSDQTVYFAPLTGDDSEATLLHELGHATLDHQHIEADVQLLKLERAAWDEALRIAPSYGVKIDDDTVEDALDSYREWLHARSACPQCSQAGLQTADNRYTCVMCSQTWKVNDARQCGLRRYKV